MIQGSATPSISLLNSNQRGNNSTTSSGTDFNLGSVDFPFLNVSNSKIGNHGVSNPSSSSSGLKDSSIEANGERNWVSCLKAPAIFSNSPALKLAFEEPTSEDENSFAFFSSGELQPHIDLCNSYVVGYFVGKKHHFTFVKDHLTALWKTKGDFSMTLHGDQAFMFQFSLEEDRARVLELGSVHIASRLFLIRPWSPFLEQKIGSISSVPIWMILRDVPLHLWNATGFSRISSLVGKPIMTDAPTALTRMSFARVCVEIDADCSYPDTLPFRIDDKKYMVRVEYPWKPNSCAICKSFGHKSEKCCSNPAPKYTQRWVLKQSMVSQALVVGENDSTSLDPLTGEQGSLDTTVAEQVPLHTSVVNGDGREKSQQANKPPTEEWSAARKGKNTASKGIKPSQVSTCLVNTFEVLKTCTVETIVSEDSSDILTNSGEDSREEEDNIFGCAELFCEEPVDDLASGEDSVIVKEKSSRGRMTKATNTEKLLKFSALVASKGCNEDEKKNIFNDLADKYQKSWKERELDKLGCKAESSLDQ